MSSKVYREIVQAGLDTRAAERVEANLEKQARLLRLIISDNHSTKTLTASQLAQKKAKEEEEARNAAHAKSQQERTEKAKCYAWYRFIGVVFGPLIAAALLASLAGTAPIAFLLHICMAAYTGLLLVTSIIAFFPKTARAEIRRFIRSMNKN